MNRNQLKQICKLKILPILKQTDLDKEKEKQRNVNAFVMQWITGSPIISVYKKGIEISKNKEMKKLIKLTDEKKLDDYIKDKLKITA
ncbi:MAG: hypothetical protein ABIQ31_04280 [Ferruginibacter sp.]